MEPPSAWGAISLENEVLGELLVMWKDSFAWRREFGHGHDYPVRIGVRMYGDSGMQNLKWLGMVRWKTTSRGAGTCGVATRPAMKRCPSPIRRGPSIRGCRADHGVDAVQVGR